MASGEIRPGDDDAGGVGAPPMPAPVAARHAGDGCLPPCSEIDENAVKNLAFLNALDPKEAEKYMGEWIAVAGGRIVAHGEDPEQVCRSAHEASADEPHMRYIYASPEEVPWFYVPN